MPVPPQRRWELELHAAEGVIAIRSASRIGYSDLGVNRKRVEALRTALAADGRLGPGAGLADS